MSDPSPFDPYAVFAALDRRRVSYVVVGAFARVVHGSGETTHGLDIVPSLREENLGRLARALLELDAVGTEGERLQPAALGSAEASTAGTQAGELTVIPTPWGTRGYDDLRIRAFRENLGRGLRPQIASLADCVRMLAASDRHVDVERLQRLRRLMDLERQLAPRRGLGMER